MAGRPRRMGHSTARRVLRGLFLSPFGWVCLVLFAALGCGLSPDHSGARGSTITVLYDADERLFGPYWSMPSWFLMFLPLATYDESGHIVGRLARSWEHSSDYRTWTFHLRADARWHDGEPVTAADIKFSIELAAHPHILFDDSWHGVDSIAVRDDSTLTLFYGRPRDARDTWNVYWPKHLLEGLDPEEFFNWEFWTHPVGDGPYRYVRHVPKTMVELEANPDYFRGKPKVDRLVFKFGGGSGLTELFSGNVEVMDLKRSEIPKLAADPRFAVYYQLEPSVPWLTAIFWNQRHSLFSSPEIRRALTLAIDRRELLRILNMPEGLPIVDVAFTGRQYAAGDLPPPLPYDTVLARRLLEEQGWRDADGDGVRERDGQEFAFTAIVSFGTELEQVAVYVQALLRRVGVRMEVQPLDNSLVRRKMRSGDFQAAFFPYWNAPEGHLRWLGEGSPLGYDDPRVAARLARVNRTADPSAQDRIYRDLRPFLQEAVPLTFLFPQLGTSVVSRRLRGLRSPYRGDPVQFMEDLWIEEP